MTILTINTLREMRSVTEKCSSSSASPVVPPAIRRAGKINAAMANASTALPIGDQDDCFILFP